MPPISLHGAAKEGRLEDVRRLIVSNADLEARDDQCKEDTPLHLAAESGHLSVTRALLEAAADVQAESMNRWTPLHFAAASGHALVVRLLIDAGAKVTAKSSVRLRSTDSNNLAGWTPLHLAASDGHDAAAQVLLDAGGSARAVADRGKTPLHCAMGALLALRMKGFDFLSLIGEGRGDAMRLARYCRTVDMLCMQPVRQRRLACAMGQHPRLGAGSSLREFEPALMGMILELSES